MNSAGFTGAMPTMMLTRPLSRSSCVVVVSSTRTKNASSGLEPKSAPARHCEVRKFVTASRSRAHRR